MNYDDDMITPDDMTIDASLRRQIGSTVASATTMARPANEKTSIIIIVIIITKERKGKSTARKNLCISEGVAWREELVVTHDSRPHQLCARGFRLALSSLDPRPHSSRFETNSSYRLCAEIPSLPYPQRSSFWEKAYHGKPSVSPIRRQPVGAALALHHAQLVVLVLAAGRAPADEPGRAVAAVDLAEARLRLLRLLVVWQRGAGARQVRRAAGRARGEAGVVGAVAAAAPLVLALGVHFLTGDGGGGGRGGGGQVRGGRDGVREVWVRGLLCGGAGGRIGLGFGGDGAGRGGGGTGGSGSRRFVGSTTLDAFQRASGILGWVLQGRVLEASCCFPSSFAGSSVGPRRTTWVVINYVDRFVGSTLADPSGLRRRRLNLIVIMILGYLHRSCIVSRLGFASDVERDS
nr:hypothetical protein CFP56_13151 [Quercus suber]